MATCPIFVWVSKGVLPLKDVYVSLLLKKMSHLFKIFNKHVFCEHIIIHLHSFIVTSHKRPIVKKFETTDVE